MKITLRYTRKVLFEKFNIKHEMRDFLLSRIEGCEIKYLKKYPDSTFFVKNDKFIFEQDRKTGRLWVRYEEIWSIFESKYQLSYKQIQAFIIDILEDQLKMEGLTPSDMLRKISSYLESQLKMDGLTPKELTDEEYDELEDQLKIEGFTPSFYNVNNQPDLENQLKWMG